MPCGVVGERLMLRIDPARYGELLARPGVDPVGYEQGEALFD